VSVERENLLVISHKTHYVKRVLKSVVSIDKMIYQRFPGVCGVFPHREFRIPDVVVTDWKKKNVGSTRSLSMRFKNIQL
jgi:hypothetical protein